MKTQMKLQKIIVLLTLIVSAVAFLYALGFMTGLYNLRVFAKENGGEPRVPGANIYYEIQPFNRILLTMAIALILVTLLLYITMTHSRRKYYLVNFIASIGVAAFHIVVAIWAMLNISAWKAYYLATIDFDAWEKLAQIYRSTFTRSTFWFDAGYVVFALVIVAGLALLANLVWKTLLMKQEKKMLSGELGKEALHG